MNYRPSSLFTADYRIEGTDYAALRQALDRTQGLRIALGYLAWIALVAAAFWLSGGTVEELVFTVDLLLRGRAPLWHYALLLLPPTLAALHPLVRHLLALLRAAASRHAERDVHLDFTPDGIEGHRQGLYSRIAWGRISRLLETDTHLFLFVSGHDPVILPRRALSSRADYDTLVGFIRARTGLRTA